MKYSYMLLTASMLLCCMSNVYVQAAAAAPSQAVRVIPCAKQGDSINLLLLYKPQPGACGPVSQVRSTVMPMAEQVDNLLKSIHPSYAGISGLKHLAIKSESGDLYVLAPVTYQKVTDMNRSYEYIWFNYNARHFKPNGMDLKAKRFGNWVTINLHPEFAKFLHDNWQTIEARIGADESTARQEAPMARTSAPASQLSRTNADIDALQALDPSEVAKMTPDEALAAMRLNNSTGGWLTVNLRYVLSKIIHGSMQPAQYPDVKRQVEADVSKPKSDYYLELDSLVQQYHPGIK